MAADTSWMSLRYSEIKKQGLDWNPPTLETSNDARCVIDGQETIMLSANNYLNLTNHPKVIEAMISATSKYGAGSCLLYTSPSPRDRG